MTKIPLPSGAKMTVWAEGIVAKPDPANQWKRRVSRCGMALDEAPTKFSDAEIEFILKERANERLPGPLSALLADQQRFGPRDLYKPSGT
jgi:hypothetical protein